MVGVGKHRGMGIDKLGDGAKDIDFNKQVRKAKRQPTDEAIIDGVTHDSIAGFVAATNAAKANGNVAAKRNGWWQRLWKKD